MKAYSPEKKSLAVEIKAIKVGTARLAREVNTQERAANPNLDAWVAAMEAFDSSYALLQVLESRFRGIA